MDYHTRRTAISTIVGGVAATQAWGQSKWQSQARSDVPVTTRYDLATPQGQIDLAKYAKAVAVMNTLPEGDPHSWNFQWYIHAVRGDRTKASELARIYPTPSKNADLAKATWATCQAHSAGTFRDDFLPWHRGYLMCFEQTIRSVLNDASFSLPYWNYTDVSQHALPPAFRNPSDPIFKSLYQPNRRSLVNSGAAIDSDVEGPTPLNLDALSQRTYSLKGPKDVGFCGHLDANLHGSVHVKVGNSQGMGSIQWAASDPIFWIHHANIDRLWASWNAGGGLNPSQQDWLDRKYKFPDGLGRTAEITNSSISNLGLLSYAYDRLEDVPQTAMATSGGLPPRVVARAADTSVAPGGSEISLTAVPVTAASGGAVATSPRRTYLRITGLKALAIPGVLYVVQVMDRGGVWQSIGQVNFFDAVIPAEHDMGDMGGMEHLAAPSKIFVFDISAYFTGGSILPRVRLMPESGLLDGLVVSLGDITIVQA